MAASAGAIGNILEAMHTIPIAANVCGLIKELPVLTRISPN